MPRLFPQSSRRFATRRRHPFQGQAFHLVLRRIVRRRLGRGHVDIGGNDLRAGFRHGDGDGLADTVAAPVIKATLSFRSISNTSISLTVW